MSDALTNEKGLPKYEGQSPEISPVSNPKGVWRHPESGEELIAVRGPQADAFKRVGYVYVAPAPGKAEQSAKSKKAASEATDLKKQLAEANARAEAAEKEKAEATAAAADAEERAKKAEQNAEEALKLAEESADKNKKTNDPKEGNK